MITKQAIDQFYKDVEAQDLKFPVAALADATGENKGNVSKILNKQKEPSESFLKRFYEKFPKGSKKVSDGNGVTWNETDYQAKYIALLEEKAEKGWVNSNAVLERLDEVLAGQVVNRQFLARLLAKVEKQDVRKIELEISKALNGALDSVGSGGKG